MMATTTIRAGIVRERTHDAESLGGRIPGSHGHAAELRHEPERRRDRRTKVGVTS
jgi:hypothetical protein